MPDEHISSDTLKLLTSYYGSMVRRLERLAASVTPELSRADLAREVDLRIAAEAARRIVAAGERVKREAIFDLLELDQPGLSYDALLKRWNRHRPPLRLPEILARAMAV